MGKRPKLHPKLPTPTSQPHHSLSISTMAACYDPIMPMQLAPQAPTSPPGRQTLPVMSCIGLLHDAASNCTFRIPDVPAKSSVAHIKQWYCKNVTAVDPRNLLVLHNGQPVDDTTQVWQLAQGQGQFAVTVTPTQTSPRSMLNLYVDTNLPMPPVGLQISSDSTVLYVKQRVLELVNQPMALATAPQTMLVLPPNNSPLNNSRTLAECGVQTNTRLAFSFSQQDVTAVGAQSTAATLTPTLVGSSQPEFSRIRQIWSSPPATSNNNLQKSDTPTGHALLP